MQAVIVILIVAAAAVIAGVRIYKALKGDGSCNCGCSGCCNARQCGFDKEEQNKKVEANEA